MAKKTVNKKTNFTTIHNKLINDDNISLKAKGIMLYMLSKPEDWNYNPKEIAKNSKDGLDSVYSGIKELIEAGYISRIRHSDGTVDYFVFEDIEENDVIDFSKKESQNPNRENPNRENPNRENPNRENPDVYKRKNTTKERIILNIEYTKEKNTKKEIEDFINSQDKTEEYKNLLFEFVRYRRKIKDSVKTTGPIKLLLKNFSDEVALKEALEYMDLYNWKTAEPEWIENKKRGGKNGNSNNVGNGKKQTRKPDYNIEADF
ncbi:helix-turn-helix domain-containing protein [Leptotrichia sp. OH3620_COT-345]|uniref:helix-turn-helix domain-containing protein n=1 Tax=Leptotrichia sp. OH3620_COT-345 TaxID=2491048 RepID=UPI000F64C2E9|nr:helix-turn-helix domain-containing protein [Leptotrichia sp. OH3620_COT-345]RRD39274.1 helix-turn-helix domain-containing protein [Leptotrichia sp. OH3620_COT-345]